MTATNKLFKDNAITPLAISDYISVGNQSEPITELLVWIQDSGILSSLSYSVSSKSESSSNLIRFSLSDHHQNYFPILRGLLSMGTKFNFRTDIKAKAFTVEIGVDQLNVFKDYLKHIVSLLKAEINFKKALRRIIAFEKEIASRQVSLQGALHNSLTTQ